MGALRMRMRAEIRSRWRATLALALLIAVTTGGVFAAAAGARRTSSAFERLLERSRASDVLVNPDLGSDSKVTFASIAGSPEVADAAYVDGMGLVVPRADGSPDFSPELSIIALASVDGKAGYSIERPKIIEGRMPDRARADEVFVNPVFTSRLNRSVGDRVTLLAADFSAFVSDPNLDTLPPMRRVTFTIVGVGVLQSEVVVDEGFVNLQMLLTPAFYRANPKTRAGYWGAVVRLKNGARDLPAFRAGVDALTGPDEAIEYQTTTATATKVRDAVHPQALALALFAAALAGTGILLIGQNLGRQIFVESEEHPALNALGFTRRQLLLLSITRPALATVTGTLAAVGIAIAASPLMPIGPARLAEPDLGVSVDGVVLGVGGVAVVVTILLLAAVPAWRAARRVEAGDAVVRPSGVAEALRKASFSPTAITGVRFALEPGRGRTSLPVRTTLGAAAIAVASVAAALTFAAGLDHLVKTPQLFGWNWDVAVASDLEPDAEAKIFAADPDVQAWSRIVISRLQLEGRNVLAVGVDHSLGYVHPTIATGRAPRAPDEIALGGRTLDRLGIAVGDHVVATYGNARQTFLVVGRAVFPGLGTYPGADKTGPGDGAMLFIESLERLAPQIGSSQTLIRLRTGADAAAAQSRLQQTLAEGSNEEFADAARVRRPAEIVNYGRVRSTPIVLAGFLALLAIGSVAHALWTAVRRRRRDLALLKTFGFVRRQVRSAIAWQATTVALIAAGIGVPVGIVLGRWSWTTLAEQLGTVPDPRTPVVAITLVAAAALLASNLLAALPARSAARTPPALVLRSE